MPGSGRPRLRLIDHGHPRKELRLPDIRNWNRPRRELRSADLGTLNECIRYRRLICRRSRKCYRYRKCVRYRKLHVYTTGRLVTWGRKYCYCQGKITFTIIVESV